MPQRFGSKFGIYYEDTDQEIAEELAPDPFSEEPHSLPHRRRYRPARGSRRQLPEQKGPAKGQM